MTRQDLEALLNEAKEISALIETSEQPKEIKFAQCTFNNCHFNIPNKCKK